jgi:hypothetical protein
MEEQKKPDVSQFPARSPSHPHHHDLRPSSRPQLLKVTPPPNSVTKETKPLIHEPLEDILDPNFSTLITKKECFAESIKIFYRSEIF